MVPNKLTPHKNLETVDSFILCLLPLFHSLSVRATYLINHSSWIPDKKIQPTPGIIARVKGVRVVRETGRGKIFTKVPGDGFARAAFYPAANRGVPFLCLQAPTVAGWRERRVIKERRGAFARNKPASKKRSESYVIRRTGCENRARRVAQLETHGRAGVSFFPCFSLPFFFRSFFRCFTVMRSFHW